MTTFLEQTQVITYSLQSILLMSFGSSAKWQKQYRCEDGIKLSSDLKEFPNNKES